MAKPRKNNHLKLTGNEEWVLFQLQKEPNQYPRELARQSDGKLIPNTIYNLLKRMEDNGLLRSNKPGPGQPYRCYELSDRGLLWYWQRMLDMVERLKEEFPNIDLVEPERQCREWLKQHDKNYVNQGSST